MAPIDQKDASTLPVFAKPVQRPEGEKSVPSTSKSEGGSSEPFSLEMEKSNSQGEIEELSQQKPSIFVDITKEQAWPNWGSAEDTPISPDGDEAPVVPEIELKAGEQISPVEELIGSLGANVGSPSSKIENLDKEPNDIPVLESQDISDVKAEETDNLILAVKSDVVSQKIDDDPKVDIETQKFVETGQPAVQKQIRGEPDLVAPLIASGQKKSEDLNPRKMDVETAVVLPPMRPRVATVQDTPRIEAPLKGDQILSKFEDLSAFEPKTERQLPSVPVARTVVAQPQTPITPTIVSTEIVQDMTFEPIIDEIDLARGLDLANAKERLNLQSAVTLSTAQLNNVIAKQIFGQVSAGLSQLGQGGIEIRLNPAELGRITIQILDGTLGQSANVLVEKPEVLDLLKRNENLLQNEFGGAGFESLSFNFDQQDNPDPDQEAEFSAASSEFVSSHQTSFVAPSSMSTTTDLDIRL